MLIKAFIVARLLGIRLLTLDATVALVPAEATTRDLPQLPRPSGTPALSPGVPPARSGAVRGGLAEAVRSIDEGARLLAEARRDGP